MNKTTKVILLWVLLAGIAIMNGLLREYGYSPLVGATVAHLLSTGIYIFLILIVMYLYFQKIITAESKRELLMIGIKMLIATIIFEFIFGHYVIGHSWEKLFSDYNIFRGRMWSVVLIFILFGPRLVGKTK